MRTPVVIFAQLMQCSHHRFQTFAKGRVADLQITRDLFQIASGENDLFNQPLLIAIKTIPRQRAWIFSSVVSGSAPAKVSASMSRKASNAGSIEMLW